MTVEEDLRAAFERQEAVVPEAAPVRARIDVAWVRVKRRRAKRRALGAAAAVLLAGAAVPVVTTTWWHGGQPDLIQAEALSGTAAPVSSDPIDVLLIGTDRRAGSKTARADTIMLLHLPADRSAGWMVSLPRGGLVDVPGEGRRQLAVTPALGGVKLTVKTVTALTGVALDAAVVVDYPAWHAVTEEVGGVPLCLDQAIPAQGGRTGLPAGCRTIDGDEATALLQGQAGLRRFSIDRDRNAQRFVAALATKLAADSSFRSLTRIHQLMAAAGSGLQIDGDLPVLLRAVAQQEKPELIGLGAPVFTSRNDGEVVDNAQWKSLYQAIRDDQLASWAAANPSYVTR
jgi:LCP family protein required for cell wall assembly